jgi:hypothetical protein
MLVVPMPMSAYEHPCTYNCTSISYRGRFFPFAAKMDHDVCITKAQKNVGMFVKAAKRMGIQVQTCSVLEFRENTKIGVFSAALTVRSFLCRN